MELPSNAIHLYFSYPEQISSPALLRSYQSLMTDDELSQMSRFYYAGHRHQYLVTRALIRTSLSVYHEVDPADWRFGKNAYGKPQISHPLIDSPVNFNLSHSRGLIVCGVVRNCDIGVDVEDTQRSTRAALESLSSYFSMQEIEDLGKLPSEQQKLRFFDYWTLKESYIKARGMGLAIPLAKFSFQFGDDRLTGFKTHPDLEDEAENWQFWRIPMAHRYRIAVAVSSEKKTGFKLSAFNVVPLQSSDSTRVKIKSPDHLVQVSDKLNPPTDRLN